MNKRICQHEKDKKFDSYEVLKTLEDPTKDEVMHCEDEFIGMYLPKYNKTMNAGKAKFNALKIMMGVDL